MTKQAWRMLRMLLDDLRNRRYADAEHCKHGTYVGNWAGPDYMCGACENGISDFAYAVACIKAWLHDNRVVISSKVLAALVDALNDDMIKEYYTPERWEQLILQMFDLAGAFKSA
jgi:hypothetical protein